MEMGEFRYPVYTLDSKADLNYGEAQRLRMVQPSILLEPERPMLEQ
jgi:hypothetical protein